MLRPFSSSFGSLGSFGALCASALVMSTYAHDAHACGGGVFYLESDQESVSVAGHAVVVSISKTQTVLWDRITYAGAPADFAWVMPVSSGAKLEIASAAWIDAMVGGTSKVLISPEVACEDVSESSSSGGCCGSALDGGGGGGDFGNGKSGGEREGVIVVDRATVGPYMTETIKSDVPGAIGKWLTDNGYAIPAAMGPILDDYAAKGLEFLAAKLKPGSGVADMKPVRVVMSGGLTTFPMRMLAAGAKSKVPISLTVISEGRYEAKGFTNTDVNPMNVRWDFGAGKSNYAALLASLLASNGGATWVTVSALEGGLVSPLAEPFGITEGQSFPTLAELYFARGRELGELACPTTTVEGIAGSSSEVVELCADTTMPCSKLGAGQIDSALLGCGTLTDLGKALVGMHPKDVWVTHLEASLPVASLATDLTLVPAAEQQAISHVTRVYQFDGDPCSDGAVAAIHKPSRSRRAATPLGVMAFGVVLAFARKASRKRRG